ncbi:deoxyhypusine synthase [Candidatus Woesearchaeota archaeon]|nr:deoxyhypusine synthase [Candidatus Woesearchaeota archaeon]
MAHYEQLSKDKLKQAHQANFVAPTMTLDDWPAVKGYDFNKPFGANEFFASLFTTGFQATELAKAISILKEMKSEKATVFFGFTSNMASCGVRDIIAWLCKERLVDVLVTTIGGVEEDLIKLLKPFVLGSYDTPGKVLRDHGINRTGNLFIPNDRYLHFERFMNKFLERVNNEYTKKGDIMSTRQFCAELGKEAGKLDNKEESIYYWCWKNDIPVFCPAPTDGSIGDMLFFFKQQHPEFKLDLADDIVDITKIALNAEKTGIIAIGGSVPKHHIANANLFREGADYAIYLTTATEFEGSNAGANIEEAISWGKVKDDAKRVKVVGDASITFPLLVAGAFKLDIKQEIREEKNL